MSLDATLEKAATLLRNRLPQQAHDVLAPAMKLYRPTPNAHQIMGLILHSLGDGEGAERELRAAVAMAPAIEVTNHTLARMLASQQRFLEAAAVHAAFARAAPTHQVADYWRAQALMSAGDEAEAEKACRLAMAKGLNRPEPWLFLARILMGQRRFAEADKAYREVVKRDPTNIDAHRELAQLIWMQTADVAKAASVIDTTPNAPALITVKVKLLQDAGEHEAAYAVAAARAAKDPRYGLLAARAALRVDPDKAPGHLAQTAADASDEMTRLKVEIEVWLAVGDIGRAAAAAERLRQGYPQDQYGLTLQSTVWRLQGDPRYGELYDYARLVKTYRIEPPEGWSDFASYMAALETGLDALHGLKTHPLGQSVRHGSQTHRSLLKVDDPAIKAFFTAIDGPIRSHIQAVGEGAQDYRIAGVWSVRLNREGFHTDHVHPEGWLSSAFYVRLPNAIEAGRQGWIKFGEPGTPTRAGLQAEHFVKPEPGILVLFPSYMWHGTVPFESDETRLTAAFDLVRHP